MNMILHSVIILLIVILISSGVVSDDSGLIAMCLVLIAYEIRNLGNNKSS
jgi:hypothetical protein